MTVDLILRKESAAISQAQKPGILEIYGVKDMVDIAVTKERSKLLSILQHGTALSEAANKLSQAKRLEVIIPNELQNMIRSGKAAFDQSSKHVGALTPNIRIVGEDGIKGQAVLMEKFDVGKLTESLSNLAMMASVQGMMQQLDILENKINDVLTGQTNDRLGEVLGAFKAFKVLYPTMKNEDEIRAKGWLTFIEMQKGLAKLHLQADEKRIKLLSVPKNKKQVFEKTLKNVYKPDYSYVDECRNMYYNFIYDLQVYARMLMMSDAILLISGYKDVIPNNHLEFSNYYTNYLDDDFKSSMKFLMNNQLEDINSIYSQYKDYENNLLSENANALLIEL